MSRIGKRPVPIPTGVTVTIDERTLTVKGPRGELRRTFHPSMTITIEDGQVMVQRPSDETLHKALHGLSRTLVANMVEGVTKGYTKALELQGVGYKAEVTKDAVQLAVGFSHPVRYATPAGVKITAETPTQIKIEGADKELVGQVAAEIRGIRPPEPYKGKGIRYAGEKVRRKAGKTAQAAK